jgi:hypothetical protein
MGWNKYMAFSTRDIFPLSPTREWELMGLVWFWFWFLGMESKFEG